MIFKAEFADNAIMRYLQIFTMAELNAVFFE
jgi:hypothetical protein